jgi:GrpB-like predicted nucleotidyltransferase (UPF0157 family)
MVKRVVVVPHDPSWADEFSRVSAEVCPAFGPNLVALHHVGSTSIPGIYAKPIIDMVAAVRDVSAVDQLNGRFESLGFVPKGEFGIPGRRYFYRNDASGVRTHQIHTFEADSIGVARHLAFRDFLIAHPQIASSYSDLKRRMAAAHPEDIEAYMDGKDSFIKDVEAKALVWAADRLLVS